MLFQLFAWAGFASLLSFSAGLVFELNTMTVFESAFFNGGIFFTLVMYAALTLAFLQYFASAATHQLKRYFSPTACLQRKLLTRQLKKYDLLQRHAFEKRQVFYRTNMRRRRLARTQYKTSLRDLSALLRERLEVLKPRLPISDAQNYKQQMKHYLHTEDFDALIDLYFELVSYRDKTTCQV